MKESSIRAISAILAFSGAAMSLRFAYILPLLLPGIIIWLAWIAISLGYKKINNRKFWFWSTVWNTLVLIPFLTVFIMKVSDESKTMISPMIYPILHLIISSFVSLFVFKRMDNKEPANQAPQTTSASARV